MKDVVAKTFVLQHDHTDCGVACLASIIKFHGGDYSFDRIRKLSGTSKQGTTLLGLMQAAQRIGFEAEGLEAETVTNLHELKSPAILHVVLETHLQHYLVYYPQTTCESSSHLYVLGDPSKGVLTLTGDELEKIWRTKTLLSLEPNDKFERRTASQIKRKAWVFSLIKDDFNVLLTSLFLGIAISILGITTAIFSQKLIDDILPNQNVQKLVTTLILVAVLLFIRGGLAYLRGLMVLSQGVNFNNRIIRSFYDNLLQLPKSFFDTRKTGELIARMNDTRRIQSVISAVSGIMIIDFLLVVTSIVFVFTYSVIVGLIVLCSLPFFFLILYLFNKPIMRNQKEAMIGYAMAESNFVDTIQGVADIKLMNKQGFFGRMNRQIYESFQRKAADLGKLNIKFGLTSEIISVSFIVIVFAAASWLVLNKQLKLGELVALLGMAGTVMPAANRLVIANIQIQEAKVAFDRMFEFTSLEKEHDGGDSIFLPDNVEIQNLSFRFPGRKKILKNISLNFGRGEIVALLGESGGGKSTLLQLIQKFYIPETGKILVGTSKVELDQINTLKWREQIGCVPQEVKVFNGNLLFNITLNDSLEEHEQAIAFCNSIGLGKYFGEFPQGYLTLLGEEGINISGGQKQLVALARALFRKPKILLLDEATSAMDKNTEAFVLELLGRAKKEMAVLMITHRTKIANWCDRIFLLENGVIARCEVILDTNQHRMN